MHMHPFEHSIKQSSTLAVDLPLEIYSIARQRRIEHSEHIVREETEHCPKITPAIIPKIQEKNHKNKESTASS